MTRVIYEILISKKNLPGSYGRHRRSVFRSLSPGRREPGKATVKIEFDGSAE